MEDAQAFFTKDGFAVNRLLGSIFVGAFFIPFMCLADPNIANFGKVCGYPKSIFEFSFCVSWSAVHAREPAFIHLMRHVRLFAWTDGHGRLLRAHWAGV